VAGVHVTVDGRNQIGVTVEVGKSLREIDRPVLVCQAGHHGKDADADIRQSGFWVDG